MITEKHTDLLIEVNGEPVRIARFESLINFERLQWVKLNPDNPGIARDGMKEKALKRKGQVRQVYCDHSTNGNGFPTYFPNGKIAVLWEGQTTARIYNYKNLLIIK